MSVSTSDPLPDMTAAEAQMLSAACSQASVDLWSLCLARRGYFAHRERIAEAGQLARRLRLLAFALLDAAGWPPEGEGLDLDEEYAFDRYTLPGGD